MAIGNISDWAEVAVAVAAISFEARHWIKMIRGGRKKDDDSE